MIGRAGVISNGIQRQKRDKNYLSNYYEQISQNPQKTITYSKFPLAVWFVGLFFVVMGLVLVWHIAFYIPETLFTSFRQGTWWQYLVSIGITVLGVLFVLAGSRTVVELNRDKDLISISHINICCNKKTQKRKISECINAQIVKKGIDSFANNTAHFELVLYFSTDRPLMIYETGDKLKIKKKYIAVINYLGFEVNVENIRIVDQSTKLHPTADQDNRL